MIDLTKKALPNTVMVGGRAYSIYTDFRVWMRFEIAVSKLKRGEKIDISYSVSSIKMDSFFDGLRPASYKMLHGTSGRTHYGMIAQDVEELMQVLEMDSKDFAGFVKSEKDEETHYGLRYGEFIALCIDQIQRLKKRVKALEGIA